MEFMTAFGSVRPPYPPNTRGIRNDVVAAPEAIKGATMPLDSRDFDDARTFANELGEEPLVQGQHFRRLRDDDVADHERHSRVRKPRADLPGE